MKQVGFKSGMKDGVTVSGESKEEEMMVKE